MGIIIYLFIYFYFFILLLLLLHTFYNPDQYIVALKGKEARKASIGFFPQQKQTDYATEGVLHLCSVSIYIEQN